MESVDTGKTWEVLPNMRRVPRATYYNKEGRELPNLPADPYHLAKFLAKGFTLEKPNKEVNK